MSESEKISVLENKISNKIKIKGSQFCGYAIKTSSEQEAKQELELIKKSYYTATHHCYAFKLKSGTEKYSDDGEPNGAAGIRILNAINSFSLTDILVIVVRYFGGTKLGIGPLGKAYSETATLLLDNAPKVELTKYEKFRIVYNYEELNLIHYVLNKFNCKQITNKYKETPLIEALIEPYKIDNFKHELSEKTSGKVRLERLNTILYLRLK